LQAVLAKPAFETLLPKKWEPAIPIFAVFAVGMIGRMMYGPSEALLLSARRTRTHAIQSAIYAACFITLVYIAAWQFALMGAAAAYSLGLLVYGPIAMTTATKPMGGTLASSLRITARPLLLVVIGIAPAGLLAWWSELYLHQHLPQWLLNATSAHLSAQSVANILILTFVPIVHAAVYVPLIRLWARDEWADLTAMLRPLLQRLPIVRSLLL
jgi:hypothetical protein